MSGAAIVRYLLANDAALTAAVAASKIKAGAVPINTTLPAISIRQISAREYESIKRGTNQLVIERVQISALTETYPQQKSILNLVRAALPATRGTVNGFVVDSIIRDTEGPDLQYDDPVMFEQSIDYMVGFVR
jgi:hypothetical protein